MNQILNSEPNFNNNYSNNNYNNNNNNNNKPKASIDKILRVFAVCMIVFAVGLISSGVYSYKKNQDYITENPVQEKSYAKIEAEEKNGKILISVDHDKEINQLIYSWNGDKETKIQGEGNSLEKEIDLPAGTNNLLISVIDSEGVESTFEQEFDSEDGVDIIHPTIGLEVTSEAKLMITAKDETALEFITYRWNDEEEKTVSVDKDNPKKIELEVEIKKGSNAITIVAVDTNNNTTTETKTFVGVTKPDITIVLTSDRSSLDITCKHENGIKKIEYTLNDKPYAGEWEDNPTEVSFVQKLDVGYNRIILTVTSVDGTTNVFDGQTDYYPDGEDTTANTNTTNTNTTNTNTTNTNTANTNTTTEQ